MDLGGGIVFFVSVGLHYSTCFTYLFASTGCTRPRPRRGVSARSHHERRGRGHGTVFIAFGFCWGVEKEGRGREMTEVVVAVFVE